MLLQPLLKFPIKALSTITQSRHVRPILRKSQRQFQISIDVHQFKKEELRVKARPEYVIIEGKQERETKCGYVVRQFSRKFKLPVGCDPENMKSKLSEEGILTVTAYRSYCDVNMPCETVIPIKFAGPKDPGEQSFVNVEDPQLKCDKMTQNVTIGESNKQFTIKADPDKKDGKGAQRIPSILLEIIVTIANKLNKPVIIIISLIFLVTVYVLIQNK